MALILFSAAVTHFWRNSSDRRTGMKDPPASGCGKLFHRDTSPSEGGHRPLCLFNTSITDLVVFLKYIWLAVHCLVERPTCVKVTWRDPRRKPFHGRDTLKSPLFYPIKKNWSFYETNLSKAKEKAQNKEMSPIFQRIMSAVGPSKIMDAYTCCTILKKGCGV